MTDFQIWILNLLESIPELQLQIPDIVYTYINDFKLTINCFINFDDFVPLLVASISFSFIDLSLSIFDYIKSFRGVK